MKIRAIHVLTVVVALLGIIVIPLFVTETQSLKMVVIPASDFTTEMARFGPVAESLSEQTNLRVEVVPVTDYAAVVEAMRSPKLLGVWELLSRYFGRETPREEASSNLSVARAQLSRASIARLGPFLYAQMVLEGLDVVPLVADVWEDGRPYYRCIMIARADSGIEEFRWEDFDKYTIALVDPSSTSGALIPKMSSLEHGVILEDWDECFDSEEHRCRWSRGHTASIEAVKYGSVDIAFISDRRLPEAIKNRIVAEGEIIPIGDLGKIPNPVWVVSASLGEEGIEELRQGFLNVPRSVLEGVGLDPFTEVTKEDYGDVINLAKYYQAVYEASLDQ